MRRALIASLVALATVAVVAWPITAGACGGGFGEGLSIDPSQKIVVVHKNGVETYIFSPHFCGTAAEFGLILPVPAQLSANPTLAEAKLFEELEALTAPVITKETRCGRPDGGRGVGNGRDSGASWGDSGVQVVNRGQVGIFEWVLLKADTTAAFTDWLTTNKFPFKSSAADQFGYYVTKGWYFVAFKITADTKAPPAGSQLCGDLGPITLTFPTASPVIPARIATVASEGSYWSFGWRVFAVAAKQQRSTTSAVTPLLRYSGALSDLSGYPNLGKIAQSGDRLTKVDLQFWGSSLKDDITLQDDPAQADFRQTIVDVTWIDCDQGVVVTEKGTVVVDDKGAPIKTSGGGGCAVGGSGLATSLLVLGLLLLGLCVVARLRGGRADR